MSEVWLTQEAFEALQAELAEREGPKREEIVRLIELAREEGDLKENSGYHAAKDDQGKNEARIRQLQQLLESAQIGKPDAEKDEVAHGKVVTVRFPPSIWRKLSYWLLAKRPLMPLSRSTHQHHHSAKQSKVNESAIVPRTHYPTATRWTSKSQPSPTIPPSAVRVRLAHRTRYRHPRDRGRH